MAWHRRTIFWVVALVGAVGALTSLYLTTRMPPPATIPEPSPPAELRATGSTGSLNPMLPGMRTTAAQVAKPATGGPGVIFGVVYAIDGGPASGAEVRLWEWSDGMSVTDDSVLTQSTSVNDEGTFQCESLPCGWYGVVAELDGGMAWCPVRLTLSQPVTQVLLVLREGSPISGIVVLESNEAIEGALLVPLSCDGERVQRSTQRPLAARSGERGEFLTMPLPGAAWVFRAEADGYAPCITEPISVGTRDARIVMTHGGAIRGRVERVDVGTIVKPIPVTARDESGRLNPVSTQSGKDGDFELFNLMAAAYSPTPLDDVLVAAGEPVRIEVAEGTVRDGVILKVAEGGRVRGRVYDADTGDGLEGVLLRASGEYKSRQRFAAERTATTGADGQYELLGLPAGEASVSYEPPPGYPARVLANDRKQVNVSPGSEINDVDFALRRGVAISGTVADTSNQPVAGALIWAERAMPPDSQTNAGPDGRFTLLGLDANEQVYLSAETPTLSSSRQGPFTVPSNGLDGVRLVLDIDRTASLSGVVIDRSNRPQRVYVSAYPSQNTVGYSEVRPMTRSDGLGRFTLAGLAGGEFEIRLDRGENGMIGRGVAAATLSLRPGECRKGLRLVLDEDPLTTIAGRVTDLEGKPILGVEVRAECQEPLLRTAVTDADGRYTLHEIPDRACRVVAYHEKYTLARIEGVEPGSANVDFALEPVLLIAGRVIDASTSKPIANFAVAAVQSRANMPMSQIPFRQFADPEGKFQIPLAVGADTLIAKAGGYVPSEFSINGSEELIASLEPGQLRIEGIVRDGSGKPISGALIFVGRIPPDPVRGGERIAAARTDEGGRFAVDNVAHEETAVWAWLVGLAPGSAVAVPEPGSPARVEIVLQPEAWISGTVTLDGTPVAGARVTVSSPLARALFGSAVTDEQGSYRIGGLPAQVVTVRASYSESEEEDPVRLQEEIELRAGHATEIDFGLTRTPTVEEEETEAGPL